MEASWERDLAELVRNLPDVSQLSPHVTVVKIQQSGHDFIYEDDQRRLYRSSQLQFQNLAQLTHLTFVCPLPQLPPLTGRLQTLTLTQCSLGQEGQPIRFQDLGTLRTFEIINCAGSFQIALPSNSPLVTLTIRCSAINRGGVTDDFFVSFPQGLQNFSLQQGRISETTLRRLPRTLHQLTLEHATLLNQPRVVTFFHEGCVIQGMRSQISLHQQHFTTLQQRVQGQDQAIETVLSALLTTLSSNLSSSTNRPQKVLLCAGPSGVGKTELVQAVAALTGRHLLRYDMAEFQQEHQVARLIGSPPGYVNSSEGGQLTNDVRRFPNAIVLFDEMEKAHRQILQAFLGLFDAGRLSDSRGNLISFTRTIIFMTSNLGAAEIAALDWNQPASSNQAKIIISDHVKNRISPEFLGRIDEIVTFRPILGEILRQVLRNKAAAIIQNVASQQGLILSFDPTVFDHLVQTADPATGARKAVKNLEDQTQATLAMAQMNQGIQRGDLISITLNNHGKFRLEMRRD